MSVPTSPIGGLPVGMQLPVQATSTLFAEGWESDAGPAELVAVARAADDAGLAYVGVCDHTAIPLDHVEAMGATWYEPLVTLSHLAAVTTRVRLLSHVLVLAARPPLQVAKALATLDRLSGGRLVIGVGAGHVAAEFAAVGVDFDERGAALDEAIDLVRAALTDEVVHHDGPRYPARDVVVAPRPVQQPPPIWVGGSSPAALRRAAERGDGWIPQGTRRSTFGDQVRRLREHRAATRGDAPIEIGAMVPPMYVGTPSWDLDPRTLTGSPDALAERLREYANLGATNVQIRLRSRSADELCDQIARFGAEVLPLVGAGAVTA